MRSLPFAYLAVSAAVLAAPPSQPQVSMPRQPLRFEANQGQADSRVRFLARGPGYTLFLTGEGTTRDLRQTKDRGAALRMTVPGGDPAAPLSGEDRSPVHTSYFLGKDPSKWHSDVPSYQTLAGGASCQVTVAFTPKSGGTLAGYLTVVTNARTDRAGLSGVGVPVPRIAVSPKKLTFPATPIGTPSAALAVTVTSTGSAPLVNNGISITGTNYADFAETDNCPASLNPGQSCTVNVVMQPLVDGPLSAVLNINTNAISGAVNPILSGWGPDYTMSPNPASATVSAGDSANSTITLTPTAGLSGKVTLVCSVPSGSGITCAFVPKKVTLAGAPATSTATISTPATLASGSYNVKVLGIFTGLTGLPYRGTTVRITVQ